MNSLEDAFDHDQALVLGIGGSGDVVGCLPTARLLERVGVDVTLGGMAWEPVPYDSRPGPRRLDEVEILRRINDTVGLASGDTRTSDGLIFTESVVADHYDEAVMLVGMDRGVQGMIEDLDDACQQLGIDVVIGVDAGGDALASGDEPGLRSPVTDGYGVASLNAIDVPACLGVVGYGSDGELTIDELETAMARAASRDGLLGSWGITNRVREELEELLASVDTEASRLPVEAARGEIGHRSIRGGAASVDVRMPGSVTFYFRPAAVAEGSAVCDLIADSRSLEDATGALTAAGYLTEFEVEAQRLTDTA